MYTLESAENEVRKRWENLPLRAEVEKFIGKIPQAFAREPRAVLARQIASPNHENFRFAEVSKQTGLKPLRWTYHGDIFTTANKEKVHLGKIAFRKGEDKNGGHIIAYRTIIDFHANEKKPLGEIRTNWGEKFVDFHHRLFVSAFPGQETWDITEWLWEIGKRASEYYLRYMAIYVCHGILFENFLNGGKEKKFTQEIVQPTIDRLKSVFGVKPLIFPLLPFEKEHDPYWMWYPSSLEPEIVRLAQSA